MELKRWHWIGIVIAVISIILSIIFLRKEKVFYFILGISVVIGGLPFFIDLILSVGKDREKEVMFLEFSRNLVESVKSGTSISKSILNVRNKNYGVLTPHVNKLANQISIGIPFSGSMQTFARDIGSKTISRAITLIIEAEKAGGRIENILSSVAESVGQIEKLRKERRSAISTLVIQGYIIFFIFLGIMLVMQFKILPITYDFDIGDAGSAGGVSGISGILGGANSCAEDLTIEEKKTSISNSFLYLLVTQGLFAGLIIGKLSEGNIKSGLKHSFIMGISAMLVATGASIWI